jgi:integrase
MVSDKKVALVWYCKTAKGWRRYPIVLGANNRIRHGYVKIAGILTYCAEGRYEIRTYVNRQAVYKPAGTNAADAMAARDREVNLVAAKGFAGAAGVSIAEKPGRLYLRKAALEFEDDAKHRGALEAAEVNRNVTAEFIAVSGRVYADEVVKSDVYKFHKALRDRGCSPRTVSNKHKRLRSFFKFCKLNHTEILPPTPKYDATLPNTYAVEERANILSVADPYMRIAIELGMMCGLRDQEIQHLEWPDIRWADSTLRVTSKPHWKFKIKDSEERDIPIPSVLLEHLKGRREANPDDRLVLPTAEGKPNGKLLRSLKRLAKTEGLNCGICKGCKAPLGECQQWTLHKLRRTYGTTLLRSGLDLSTVQKFMGHSDLASTMRYLQPATSAASQAAINAITWA